MVLWLLDIFGRRQSARSVHFIVAILLAEFIIIHLALVIMVMAGPINEVRSMLTGKWHGPNLSHILDLAGLRNSAHYIVSHCADTLLNCP